MFLETILVPEVDPEYNKPTIVKALAVALVLLILKILFCVTKALAVVEVIDIPITPAELFVPVAIPAQVRLRTVLPDIVSVPAELDIPVIILFVLLLGVDALFKFAIVLFLIFTTPVAVFLIPVTTDIAAFVLANEALILFEVDVLPMVLFEIVRLETDAVEMPVKP